MPEAEVIRYDLPTWRAMTVVKKSIQWYQEQKRDNDIYGTALRKEKKILSMLKEDRLPA